MSKIKAIMASTVLAVVAISSHATDQKQPQAVAGAAAGAIAGAAAGAVAVGHVSVPVTAAQTANLQQGSVFGGSQAVGPTTVTVEGSRDVTTVQQAAQERNPVATAYAAPLTATNGTCMGSSSVGGQGTAFGLSFGSTWTDSSCDIRYDAEALRAAGLPRAAQARLCQKPDIAKAMEAAGTPCPGNGAKTAEAQPVASQQVAEASGERYTDPIVRARLGLPPLKK